MTDTDQPQNISLTNWVEFIVVDSLFAPKQKFEIIPFTEQTVKAVLPRFKIKPSNYDVFKLAEMTIKRVEQTSNIEKFVTYIVAKKPVDINRIKERFFDISNTRSGAEQPGSAYQTATLNRWPRQMPSRFVIFR